MSKHDARARIFAILKTYPGIHAGRLSHLLGLSWNGTAHHLRKLREGGFVATLRVSNRRLYFLPEDEAAARAAAALTSAAARTIARQIYAKPGEDARAIAIAAGLSRRVVYHHAKRLRDFGALVAMGEPLRFHPTPLLMRLMGVTVVLRESSHRT